MPKGFSSFDTEFVESALKALATVHVDMLRVYQATERELGRLFPEEIQRSLRSETTVGRQFQFWNFLLLCSSKGLSLATLSGNTIIESFFDPANVAPPANFSKNFEELFEKLKKLCNALYITATPPLVGFMTILVHNKIGVDLNLFAHPNLDAMNIKKPDDFHRRRKMLEAFQVHHLNSPALAGVWDERVNFTDILDWSVDHWKFVCQKGAATSSKSITSVWRPATVFQATQSAVVPTVQPTLGSMTPSEVVKNMKRE